MTFRQVEVVLGSHDVPQQGSVIRSLARSDGQRFDQSLMALLHWTKRFVRARLSSNGRDAPCAEHKVQIFWKAVGLVLLRVAVRAQRDLRSM
jgi:hypothetical protein